MPKFATYKIESKLLNPKVYGWFNPEPNTLLIPVFEIVMTLFAPKLLYV